MGTSEYLLTECAAGALQAVEEALANPPQRALSVVGPYGAGKSAFWFTWHDGCRIAAFPGAAAPSLVVGSRRPLAGRWWRTRASLDRLRRKTAGLRRR